MITMAACQLAERSGQAVEADALALLLLVALKDSVFDQGGGVLVS
jgi:hypothetical protein